jgi:hypothetical protein
MKIAVSLATHHEGVSETERNDTFLTSIRLDLTPHVNDVTVPLIRTVKGGGGGCQSSSGIDDEICPNLGRELNPTAQSLQ